MCSLNLFSCLVWFSTIACSFMFLCGSNEVMWRLQVKKDSISNKRYSNNTNASTSVTNQSIQRTQTPQILWHLTLWCDLDLSSRSRKLMSYDVVLLYCTLVPGMMSMGLMFYKISPIAYFMWPLAFICDLQLLSRSLTL